MTFCRIFSAEDSNFIDLLPEELLVRYMVATLYSVTEIQCIDSVDSGSVADLSMTAMKSFLQVILRHSSTPETLKVSFGIASDEKWSALIVPVTLCICDSISNDEFLKMSYNVSDSCRISLLVKSTAYLPGQSTLGDKLQHHSQIHLCVLRDILQRCNSIIVQQNNANVFNTNCYWHTWNADEKASAKKQLENEKTVLQFFSRILPIF